MIKGKQKLPEWFDGELYKEGGVVSNPYSGEKIELDNIELSMYDFIVGATLVYEMMGPWQGDPKVVKDLRKGLDWFRKNNAKAYMVLLD